MRKYSSRPAGCLSWCIAWVVLLGGCSGPAPQTPPRELPPLSRAASADRPSPRLLQHFARWAGTPYETGGTRVSGVDCSGFVQATYSQLFDVDLPRTTGAQRRSGREVAAQQLAAGDLLFFSLPRKDSHVGIYLGNGEFMHASSSRGVVKDRLSRRFWARRFSAAVRVLDTR